MTYRSFQTVLSVLPLLFVVACTSAVPADETPPPGSGGTAVSSNAGLVISLDAAMVNGSSFPGVGCSLTTWTNLAPTAHANGALNNFNSCGSTSGWLGSGISTDPFRLAFDGVDDYVTIPEGADFFSGSDVTVDLWLRWIGPQQTDATNRGIWGVVFSRQSDDGYSNLLTGLTGVAPQSNFLQFRPTSCCSGTQTTTSPGDTTWLNLVITTTNNVSNGQQIYVNGQSISSVGFSSTYNSDTVKPLTLGAWHDSDAAEFIFFRGEVGILKVYSRSLAASEVSAGCFEYASRFAGVSCQ
jgi:hypothetical protein